LSQRHVYLVVIIIKFSIFDTLYALKYLKKKISAPRKAIFPLLRHKNPNAVKFLELKIGYGYGRGRGQWKLNNRQKMKIEQWTVDRGQGRGDRNS
jgi:hypothetical protein